MNYCNLHFFSIRLQSLREDYTIEKSEKNESEEVSFDRAFNKSNHINCQNLNQYCRGTYIYNYYYY